MNNSIDLRECEQGDFLLCSNGALLEYVRPCTEKEYLDHLVKYLIHPDVEVGSNSHGTRTHDGKAYPKNPAPKTDQDVTMILKKKEAYEVLLKHFQSQSIFEGFKHEGETYFTKLKNEINEK